MSKKNIVVYDQFFTNDFKDSKIKTKEVNFDDVEWLINQISHDIKEVTKFLDKEQKIEYINKIYNLKKDNYDIETKNIGINNEFYQFKWSENEFISSRLKDKLNIESKTSNELFMITPFISGYGIKEIRKWLDNNKELKIKIITTTFDGTSKFLDLNGLIKIKDEYNDKVDIKIENNFSLRSERIHSKIYIFKRDNDYSSAYIGSNNFTKTGIETGTEASMKISEYASKEIFNKIYNYFLTLNNRDELVDINDRRKISLMLTAQLLEKGLNDKKTELINSDPELKEIYKDQEKQISSVYTKNEDKKLYDYQEEVINNLFKRIENGIRKHLVVMATGTGKTFTIAKFTEFLINSLDKDFKMIYIAHQNEILDQAIKTFLEIGIFSEHEVFKMYDSKNTINHYRSERFIFANKNTLQNNINWISDFKFDLSIFDEAHHIEANKFKEIYEVIDNISDNIIGMTATPERTDGVNVSSYFGWPYAAEIRIYDAINNGYLSDFDYYFISDNTVNIEGVDIKEKNKLGKLLSTNKRNDFILKTINEDVELILNEPKVILFTASIEHAKSIANFLHDNDKKVDYLVSKEISTISNKSRKEILESFQDGDINYLVVVDILNEGVDIPNVNGLMFLRPTESLLIYLQQLGRGLRKYLDKKLQVWDFVNNVDININKKYNFLEVLKAMINVEDYKIIQTAISNEDFSNLLPGESQIEFSLDSQSRILTMIRKYLSNYNNILKEYKNKDYLTYEEFEDFFNTIDESIFSFYSKGNCLIKNNENQFNKLNTESKYSIILKNISVLNNEYVIDKYLKIIENAKKDSIESINMMFYVSVFYNEIKESKYYENTEQGWKLIFDNISLFKEVEYLLTYIKRNNPTINKVVSNDPETYIGMLFNKIQISNLIRKNYLDNTIIRDAQNSGIWSFPSGDNRTYMIKASDSTKDTDYAHYNTVNYKTKELLWESPDGWSLNPKPGSLNDMFLNNLFENLLIAYTDEEIEKDFNDTIYKLLGKVSKGNLKLVKELKKEKNGLEINKLLFEIKYDD